MDDPPITEPLSSRGFEGESAERAPEMFCGEGLTWLLFAAAFRFSSLAALAAFLVAPIGAKVLGWAGAPAQDSLIPYHQMAEVAGLLAVIIWIRHAANIRRLLRGEEPKIGTA